MSVRVTVAIGPAKLWPVRRQGQRRSQEQQTENMHGEKDHTTAESHASRTFRRKTIFVALQALHNLTEPWVGLTYYRVQQWTVTSAMYILRDKRRKVAKN